MTPADDPACDPRRRDIGRRLLMCNVDELDVLDELLARIEKGRDLYGWLDLEKARDWDRELAEELLDVSVYRAIGRVRHKRALANVIAAPGVSQDWDLSDLGEEIGGEG